MKKISDKSPWKTRKALHLLSFFKNDRPKYEIKQMITGFDVSVLGFYIYVTYNRYQMIRLIMNR